MDSWKYRLTSHQSVLGLLLLIGFTTTPTQADDEVTVVPIDRDLPGRRLTCYTCQHSLSKQDGQDDNCVHMRNASDITQATCHIFEPFCRVRKLMKGDDVQLLERSCTQNCEPGCEKMLNKVQACTSCCAHQLCNTGSGAAGMMSRQFLTTLAVAISSVFVTLTHTLRFDVLDMT